MSQLSETALAICKQYYGDCGKNNGCGRCPIHTECTSPVVWSADGFSQHRQKINLAAEQVSGDA